MVIRAFACDFHTKKSRESIQKFDPSPPRLRTLPLLHSKVDGHEIYSPNFPSLLSTVRLSAAFLLNHQHPGYTAYIIQLLYPPANLSRVFDLEEHDNTEQRTTNHNLQLPTTLLQLASPRLNTNKRFKHR